jgi:hypothetical protein
MPEMDRGEGLDEAVAARDDDGGAPVEIHGPESEARRIVRRASPLRLALRLVAFALLLAVTTVGVWRGHAWWVEHARTPNAGAHDDRGP